MNELTLDSVSKWYGAKKVLDSVTFSVKTGRITGFLGPNGSGKTTTMRAILGITDADEGTIRWKGQALDLQTLSHCGYLPEERGLYPNMTVKEQLIFFAGLHGMNKKEAEKDIDLWLMRLGLQDKALDKLQTLSLGNQQRVQLIATLLHKPDLIIMDEPFSGLDPVAVDNLSSVLREQANRGVAVLFSSHQLELVDDICEEVVIINQGKVVVSGNLETLKREAAPEVLVRLISTKDWKKHLPVGEIISETGEGTIVRLDSKDDSKALQTYLVKQGQLEAYYFRSKKILELFKEAVNQ